MKTEFLEKLFKSLRAHGWAIAIVAVAALVSFAFCLLDGEANLNALAMWGIGAVLAFRVFRADRGEGRKCRPAAWAIMAGAFAMIWFAPDGYLGVVGALLCIALIFFTAGWRMALQLVLPIVIFVILAPLQQFIYVLLSLPMSRFCAVLTVCALHVLGISAEFDRAVISIDGGQVAVTAACSGIELLEAMLLIGVFFVNAKGRPLWLCVVHYFTLLPIIIVCNTLRLTLVIWLFTRIGEKAFEDPLHTIFGFAVTVGAILLLVAERPLFSSPAERRRENEERAD